MRASSTSCRSSSVRWSRATETTAVPSARRRAPRAWSRRTSLTASGRSVTAPGCGYRRSPPPAASLAEGARTTCPAPKQRESRSARAAWTCSPAPRRPSSPPSSSWHLVREMFGSNIHSPTAPIDKPAMSIRAAAASFSSCARSRGFRLGKARSRTRRAFEAGLRPCGRGCPSLPLCLRRGRDRAGPGWPPARPIRRVRCAVRSRLRTCRRPGRSRATRERPVRADGRSASPDPSIRCLRRFETEM